MDAAGDATGTTDSVEATAVEWRTTASRYSGPGPVGRRYAYDCPPAGARHVIWGSNPYTSDSSVCNAGVHAGVISYAAGGCVVFEMGPGQESYAASTQNGVAAEGYGAWRSSFYVLPR